MKIVTTTYTTQMLIDDGPDRFVRKEFKSETTHRIIWSDLNTDHPLSDRKSKRLEKELKDSIGEQLGIIS